MTLSSLHASHGLFSYPTSPSAPSRIINRGHCAILLRSLHNCDNSLLVVQHCPVAQPLGGQVAQLSQVLLCGQETKLSGQSLQKKRNKNNLFMSNPRWADLYNNWDSNSLLRPQRLHLVYSCLMCWERWWAHAPDKQSLLEDSGWVFIALGLPVTMKREVYFC
jgi:hypothetical protein